MPHTTDLLDKLGKAKYYSSIGLATTYHLIIIAKGDMHKTAFLAYESLYEYILMLFILCNATETFQRLVNFMFTDFINEFIKIYLDDILAHSELKNNIWFFLGKSLSILNSLNCIANSKYANSKSVRLSI